MATWYAANSSVDIDSVNEWNDQADGLGSWLTWGNLGATDILEANANTAIEINVDAFTCGSIKTLSGGGFTVDLGAGNNRVINADIIAGTDACLVTIGTTKTLTINGDITGGSASNAFGLNPLTMSSGLVVNGNILGGSAASCYGCIRCANSSTATFNGNITGGTDGTAAGIQAGYHVTITVVGNLTASTKAAAIRFYSGYHTIVLTGNLVCASNGTMPFDSSAGVRLKWTNVETTGYTLAVRDETLTQQIMKVPDYPAEAEVESGVDFDYTALTGTLAGGAGADTGAIAQQWAR